MSFSFSQLTNSLPPGSSWFAEIDHAVHVADKALEIFIFLFLFFSSPRSGAGVSLNFFVKLIYGVRFRKSKGSLHKFNEDLL